MKDKRFPHRELKLLSAYLDGELDSPRRQKLETRLENDPALRKKLTDIRRTRLTLNNLAHMKAPRNFTLTPEMVKVRRRKSTPVFTALKLASSIAGIMLVALVSIELLWGGIGAVRQMEMPASVADSDTYTAETTTEPLIMWGESEASNAAGTGGGSGDRTFSTEQESLEYMEEDDEIAPEEEAPEEEEESEILPEEETIQVNEEVSKSAEESPILGLNLDEAGEVIDQSGSSIQEDEGSVAEGPNVLRWIEIALAATAVGGLITFLILRKRY